jgi:hypothetical protein
VTRFRRTASTRRHRCRPIIPTLDEVSQPLNAQTSVAIFSKKPRQTAINSKSRRSCGMYLYQIRILRYPPKHLAFGLLPSCTRSKKGVIRTTVFRGKLKNLSITDRSKQPLQDCMRVTRLPNFRLSRETDYSRPPLPKRAPQHVYSMLD